MSTPMRAGRRLRVLLVLFTCLCLFCLLAPRLAPHDPELVNLLAAKRPPDREYMMGTDGLGRCVFSRVLAGAGSSVFPRC